MSENQELLKKYFSEDGEHVICQYCLRKLRRINPQHLAMHDMTYEEYRMRFPDAPVDHIEFENYGGVKAEQPESQSIVNIQKPKRDLLKEETINSLDSEDISSEDILRQIAKESQRKKLLVQVQPTKLDENPFIIARKKCRFHHKTEVIGFIKQFFPNLQNNYLFRKTNIEGLVLYTFITDMADPHRRTAIDFPDVFWHNRDYYYEGQKESLLKESKWRYIKIYGEAPTNQEIIDAINKHL